MRGVIIVRLAALLDEVKHWFRHDWLYFEQPSITPPYGDYCRFCRYCGQLEVQVNGKWTHRVVRKKERNHDPY
jgi:hypothetical protein